MDAAARHVRVPLDSKHSEKLARMTARGRAQEGIAQARRGEGIPLDDLIKAAQVIITPRARADVDEMITTLNLPSDTWPRIDRPLSIVRNSCLTCAAFGPARP